MDEQNLQEQDFRINDLWHERNLDLLERCVQSAERGDYYAYEPVWNCYLQNECHRLRDREMLMRHHKIEVLPHKHKEREKTLMDKLIDALAKLIPPKEIAS